MEYNCIRGGYLFARLFVSQFKKNFVHSPYLPIDVLYYMSQLKTSIDKVKRFNEVIAMPTNQNPLSILSTLAEKLSGEKPVYSSSVSKEYSPELHLQIAQILPKGSRISSGKLARTLFADGKTREQVSDEEMRNVRGKLRKTIDAINQRLMEGKEISFPSVAIVNVASGEFETRKVTNAENAEEILGGKTRNFRKNKRDN